MQVVIQHQDFYQPVGDIHIVISMRVQHVHYIIPHLKLEKHLVYLEMDMLMDVQESYVFWLQVQVNGSCTSSN